MDGGRRGRCVCSLLYPLYRVFVKAGEREREREREMVTMICKLNDVCDANVMPTGPVSAVRGTSYVWRLFLMFLHALIPNVHFVFFVNAVSAAAVSAHC